MNPNKKMQKNVLLGIGGVLCLGGIVKASIIGYYPDELPWLLVALIAGIILLTIGSKIKVTDSGKAQLPGGKIKCSCGAFNDRDVTICWSCGKELRPAASASSGQSAMKEPVSAAHAITGTRDNASLPGVWTCECGSANGATALFCGNCGKKRAVPERLASDGEPTPWMCMCGKINEGNALYCGNCGDKRP